MARHFSSSGTALAMAGLASLSPTDYNQVPLGVRLRLLRAETEELERLLAPKATAFPGPADKKTPVSGG